MDSTNEKVKTQLTNLWNWCGNNKPDSFVESDGKQWLSLDVNGSANRLKMSPEQYLTALRALFNAMEIGVKKVNSNKLLYSLSPEPKPEPEVKSNSFTPSQATRNNEAKWQAYYDSKSPEERWLLWSLTINKEWEVCSDSAKSHFKYDIQKYFGYRRTHPVSDIIKQRVYDKIRSGEFTNVYAPNIYVSAEDARKQFGKGWQGITTTGVDFLSTFSIENDDNPPDPF